MTPPIDWKKVIETLQKAKPVMRDADWIFYCEKCKAVDLLKNHAEHVVFP